MPDGATSRMTVPRLLEAMMRAFFWESHWAEGLGMCVICASQAHASVHYARP